MAKRQDASNKTPALVTMPLLAEFAEGKAIPFAKTGEWDFSDYIGEFSLSESDLTEMLEHFHGDARRQDLPIINEEHIPAEFDEAGKAIEGPGAVGWFKDMYLDVDPADGKQTLFVVPDWNPRGERVMANDEYRAVSPEILRDWTDPETGKKYGKVAAGLALTTQPRMKGLAHRGAPMYASEGAPSRARVLAFAEDIASTHVDGVAGAVGGPGKPLHRHPKADGTGYLVHAHEGGGDAGHRHEGTMGMAVAASETAQAGLRLFAESSSNFTDQPCPMCGGDCVVVYAELRCPTDGAKVTMDGATFPMPYRGLNNPSFSEGGHVTKPNESEPTTGVKPDDGAQAPAVTPPAPPVDREPADFSELKAMFAAERKERQALAAKLEEQAAENVQLREAVKASETAQKLGTVSDRLDKAAREGKITPAEREKFSENIAKFAEGGEFMLEAIEAREANSSVKFGETGKTGDGANGLSDSERLDVAAKALMSERGKSGEKMTYKAALLEVARPGFRG